MRHVALLAFLLLCFGEKLSLAQNTAPGESPRLDARELVAAALQRLDTAEADHARFTDFVEMQMLQFRHAGTDSKQVGQLRVLYEETWINDLPYNRLVEKNGQPLTGSALEAEQKRYEKAVANRKDLGFKQRGRYEGYKPLPENGIDIHNVLKSGYTLRELRVTGEFAHKFRVVEASPQGELPAPAMCPWRYIFSITENPTWLVAYRVDSPHAAKPPCNDASREVSYSLVEGYPRVLRYHVSTFLPSGSSYQRVEDLFVYSKIRRFNTSYTLQFGSEVDPGTAPAQAPIPAPTPAPIPLPAPPKPG